MKKLAKKANKNHQSNSSTRAKFKYQSKSMVGKGITSTSKACQKYKQENDHNNERNIYKY